MHVSSCYWLPSIHCPCHSIQKSPGRTKPDGDGCDILTPSFICHRKMQTVGDELRNTTEGDKKEEETRKGKFFCISEIYTEVTKTLNKKKTPEFHSGYLL